MRKMITDRVREKTADEVNQKIDEKTLANIEQFRDKSTAEIDARIAHLYKEWDIERWLEANNATVTFIFVLLGFFHSRFWLLIPIVTAPLLFLHAVHGWCPPLPLLRRMHVRTQKEIDLEIMALKILRGDFGDNKALSTKEILRMIMK